MSKEPFLRTRWGRVSLLAMLVVDVFILPVVAFAVIFVALPIKVYAFFTMNRQGWLTRHADQIGGDGQDSQTLQQPDAAPATPAGAVTDRVDA